MSSGGVAVGNGGSATDVSIFSGGYVNVTGRLNGVEVDSGSVKVFDGGIAEDITINSGGIGVSNGGTANSAVISKGTIIVSSGGTANNAVISQGSIYVNNGGVASGISIAPTVSMYVFEGGLRVPAIVRWPARLAGGQTDAAPSQFHDWMATLAAAAGATCPPESEGVSLLPRWRGWAAGCTVPPAPSFVYTQYEFPWGGASETFRAFKARKAPVRGLQQMVRVGDYVALRVRMREGGAKVRLYNVVADPFQEHDLADAPEQRTRLAEMTKLLDDRYGFDR